jgi:hypothetical protein
MQRLKTEMARILNGTFKSGGVPPLWEGKASERIANIIYYNWGAVNSQSPM